MHRNILRFCSCQSAFVNNCRYKFSPSELLACLDKARDGLSSWKKESSVGSLKWCSTGSLESHSLPGTEHCVCVFFQHSLLDGGPFHRHHGLIFGRISLGSNQIGCLTSRVLAERSLLINQERGLEVTHIGLITMHFSM